MKRTRPIRGKYFLTLPRITHEGRILEVKVKLSQVIVTDLGPARSLSKRDTRERILMSGVGEIERGRVDGEESKQAPVYDEHTGERV